MEGLAFIVGVMVGVVIIGAMKRSFIIRTATENELIADIKRRRVEERLRQEVEKSVAADVEKL